MEHFTICDMKCDDNDAWQCDVLEWGRKNIGKEENIDSRLRN